MSVAEMKKRFNCGAQLISDVRKALVEKKPLPIPGRKKINPVRDNTILIGLVDSMTRENGRVSDSDLANVLGTRRMRVNRAQHDLQFTYKALRHIPVLSQRHVGTRLAFCQNHRGDDWSSTMFTDESRFSTSPDCPVMQWVKRGDHIYVETEKFPFSIMVWGGIVGDRKTPLIKCPKSLNSQSYVEMLDRNGVVEFLAQSGDRAVFQQDGARCHTADATCRWFISKNVTLLTGWPPDSPDLSPIEQIWGITKRFIIQRFGMRKPLANDQLEEAVFDAYQNVKPSTIAILTLSVKYRIQLCIARNGGFVGDALDECCRRAKEEFEGSTRIQTMPITLEQRPDAQDAEQEDVNSRQNDIRQSLPSFRDSL